MLGCGQFAFATIGYFLRKKTNDGVAACYDPVENAANSFARFYRVPTVAKTAEEVIEHKDVKIVYIASNHASHAEYACQALEAGKTVYVEKPIAVTIKQLEKLHAKAAAKGPRSIFAGYNRPLSGAIRDLRKYCREVEQPLTLACFISGHVIDKDHWYRRPAEGTRICGNVGHWLDLGVHLLSWGQLPDKWKINLSWSNRDARDEDMAISLTSERGDLINIVLTARTEPFEGINENINLQWGTTIAKIDDFRHLTIWCGKKTCHKNYWPKDVGHRRAILQPFCDQKRDWREIEHSTLLMLKIAEMVINGKEKEEFSFSSSFAKFDVEAVTPVIPPKNSGVQK
jgi:predicted dehydrogenase